MSPQFSPEVLQAIREHGQAVDKRLAGSGKGGDFSRYARLSGQNAIAEPGGSVDVRLLPHWEFYGKMFVKGAGGKIVRNPDYDRLRLPCWHGAWEHWFDAPDGKPRCRWCRKVLGPEQLCPCCRDSEALWRGTEDEKERAQRTRQQEVFLYNVILRAQPFDKDGKPWVRILVAQPTVFSRIRTIITGGDDEGGEKFALGDVSDIYEGYDLRIFRPASQGQRYDVKAANKPSPLFPKEEAARWRELPQLLYNLEKDVLDNVPSAEDMEREMYGTASPARGGGSGAPAAAPPDEAFGGPADGAEDGGKGFGAPPPDDGGFMDFEQPGDTEAAPPPRQQPQTTGRRPAARGRR